jgi:hypothetical protein
MLKAYAVKRDSLTIFWTACFPVKLLCKEALIFHDYFRIQLHFVMKSVSEKFTRASRVSLQRSPHFRIEFFESKIERSERTFCTKKRLMTQKTEIKYLENHKTSLDRVAGWNKRVLYAKNFKIYNLRRKVICRCHRRVPKYRDLRIIWLGSRDNGTPAYKN